MNNQLILLFVLLFLTKLSFGQQLKLNPKSTKGNYYLHKSGSTSKDNTYSITNQGLFSSISIQILDTQSFDKSYIIADKDTFHLSIDEHVEIENGLINSNLITFDKPVTTIHFYSNEIENEVQFHFINGGFGSHNSRTNNENLPNDCFTEPESISQSIWRDGLNSPNFSRSFTTIKHLIIHHSAGSNTNTNFSNVVRDIYLYHTEVNGWSDIGYNYLIAQDGTIFKGRDPASGEQDNVRGAHFCGKNTGTMGVCLLGNYTSIPPTDKAINSLLNLLSWKLDKEALNAFEGFSHSNLDYLNSISGHRDGCATECPGSKTYQQIDVFRTKINQQIENCYPDFLTANFNWSVEEINAGESVSFNDNSLGLPLSWSWNLEGTSKTNYSNQNLSNIFYQNSGEFDVQLIVRSGSRMDTITKEKLIKVNEAPNYDEPLIYPNPITSHEPFTINLNQELINEISIIDVSGKEIYHIIPTSNEISIESSFFKKGIYLVQYKSNNSLKTKRIAILR